MKSSAILLLWASAMCDAFVVGPTRQNNSIHSSCSSSSWSLLHLTPSQGKQLVAASSTIYTSDDEPSRSVEKPAQQKLSLSHARAKIAQLFHLPSSLWHPVSEDAHDDIVYFPIVGMYVHDNFVVPSLTNASCRLKPTSEAVFGWYSQSCPLSCRDDDDYCQPPPPPTPTLRP